MLLLLLLCMALGSPDDDVVTPQHWRQWWRQCRTGERMSFDEWSPRHRHVIQQQQHWHWHWQAAGRCYLEHYQALLPLLRVPRWSCYRRRCWDFVFESNVDESPTTPTHTHTPPQQHDNCRQQTSNHPKCGTQGDTWSLSSSKIVLECSSFSCSTAQFSLVWYALKKFSEVVI